MVMQDSQTIATDWSNALSQSTTKITAGVNAVSVAPGVAAARQVDVWAANTLGAKAKWQRNVQKTSLADWQEAMKTKGVPRISTGAQAAIPKFAAFMSQLQPHIQAGLQKLPARGTYEQNKNRMNQWADHMHTFKMSG
jgi:hypothetical protein